MIELWGILKDDYSTYDIRELVATFDDEQQAKDYVNNSTLEAAKNKYFRADPYTGKFRYRKESLLRCYEDCEIEKVESLVPPPHNPTLEVKKK